MTVKTTRSGEPKIHNTNFDAKNPDSYGWVMKSTEEQSIEKAVRPGKPYSQQVGRHAGKGPGFIVAREISDDKQDILDAEEEVKRLISEGESIEALPVMADEDYEMPAGKTSPYKLAPALKSTKIGKPYSQQAGRKAGKGAGHRRQAEEQMKPEKQDLDKEFKERIERD